MTVAPGPTPPGDQQSTRGHRGGRSGGSARGRGRSADPAGRSSGSRAQHSRGRGRSARHREQDPADIHQQAGVEAAVAAALDGRPDAAPAVQLPEVQLSPRPATLPDHEASSGPECLICCSSLQVSSLLLDHGYRLYLAELHAAGRSAAEYNTGVYMLTFTWHRKLKPWQLANATTSRSAHAAASACACAMQTAPVHSARQSCMR